MEFNNFVTLKYLSSYMGTVVITMLLVQFFKELPGIKNIPTKYFTFIIAFFNILMTTILNGDYSISKLYLIFINAIIITFTATGGYDFSFKNTSSKRINLSNIFTLNNSKNKTNQNKLPPKK